MEHGRAAKVGLEVANGRRKGLSNVPYLKVPEQKNPQVFRSGGVLRVNWHGQAASHGGTRGQIGGYSEDSVRRFKELSERLNFGDWKMNVFATLTYHENMVNYRQSKIHLQRFLEGMKYHGLASCVWFMENQKRGAIHYHLIGVGWLKENSVRELRALITRVWTKASGQAEDTQAVAASCQCDRVKKPEGARNYLAKYLSKPSQKGLDTSEWCGRWWGVRKVEVTPWVELVGSEASKVLALAFKLKDDHYGFLPRVIYPTIAAYVIRTEPKRTFQRAAKEEIDAPIFLN